MIKNDMLSKDQILSCGNRFPFSQKELDLLHECLVAIRREQGLTMEVVRENVLGDGLYRGMVILKPIYNSQELIMLVNVCVGSDFFGRPRGNTYCFYSPLGNQNWALLGVYDRLKIAMAVIARVYGPGRKADSTHSQALLRKGGFVQASAYS